MRFVSSWRWIFAVVIANGVACSKEEKEADPLKVAAETLRTPAAPPKETPPARVTGEALGKRFEGWLASMEAKKLDEVAAMYAADAKAVMVDMGMEATGGAKIIELFNQMGGAFPDGRHEAKLVLVSGNWTAAMMTMEGTHTGDLMGMKPSNAKVVLNGFVLTEWTDDGKIKNEWHFADQATMGAQIMGGGKAPFRAALARIADKPIIAADDQKEKDNLALAAKMDDLYKKQDLTGLWALSTPDFAFHDMPMPMDITDRAEQEKMMKEGFAAFSEWNWTPVARFAAGDYIVDVHTTEAKNTGDLPSMGLKATNKPVKTTEAVVWKIEGGKLKEGWMFYNAMAFMTQLGIDPSKMEEMMKPKPPKKGKGA